MLTYAPAIDLDIYEVCNPSFNDMNLEQQCAAAVNDWIAEDFKGHQFFGRTASEARRAAIRHHSNAWCSPLLDNSAAVALGPFVPPVQIRK